MPPIPSAPPSIRASRTCFFIAMRASSACVWPGPAIRTHSSACGPNRSAAASAMYSGARSGSARMRSQTRFGGCSMGSISAISDTAREGSLDLERFRQQHDHPEHAGDHGDGPHDLRVGPAVDAGLVDRRVALAALQQPPVHRVGGEAGHE